MGDFPYCPGRLPGAAGHAEVPLQQTAAAADRAAARGAQERGPEQLARKLGVSKTCVSKYEKGERRLDVIEFLAVAQALKLDPAEVMAKVRE